MDSIRYELEEREKLGFGRRPSSSTSPSGASRHLPINGEEQPRTEREGQKTPTYLLLRVQPDRGAVYAVAQAGWLGAVVKYVAQVPAAVRARVLGPDHEVRVVGRLLDRRALRRGVEARPAAVGVELRLRLEQLGAAAGAQVRARRLRVPVLAREGALGSLLAQHVELRWGEVALPIRLALLHSHLLHRLYSAIFREAPNYLQ